MITDSNVKPIMGEEELEAALRLVQRIRLTANDGNPMYTNLEAAVLVHEYMKQFIDRAVESARTEGAIWWIDEPFVIHITPPPSTNNLYVNTQRGRAKSKAYKAWIETAGWEIREQRKGPLPHFPDEFGLRIWLPGQKDIDNIKAIPDLLKKMGIISDDKHMISLQVLRYSDAKALVALSPIISSGSSATIATG